jgi:FkbM family methyltransferase
MAIIYDIGMHNGSDTAHYLSKGFSVVAVEANPLLADAGRSRFQAEIEQGRLKLLNIGIGEVDGESTFWINQSNSEWSSFLVDVATRNGTKAEKVPIRTRTFASIVDEHGPAHYVKIDIEGHDLYCLRDLSRVPVPEYLSVEAHRLKYLAILYSAGYRQFKVVNQKSHGSDFPFGSSGPFGDDTEGEWEPLETIAYDWLHMRLGKNRRSSLEDGWFDFHAKFGGPDLLNGKAKSPLSVRSLRRLAQLPASIHRRLSR